MPFRVVQPWGPHKGRQGTLISEHKTAAAAFREIDRLSSLAKRGFVRASTKVDLARSQIGMVVRIPVYRERPFRSNVNTDSDRW